MNPLFTLLGGVCLTPILAGVAENRVQAAAIADPLALYGKKISFDVYREGEKVGRHSVSFDPEIRQNRIGIDTGAYATGVLSCAVLEGEDRRILHT